MIDTFIDENVTNATLLTDEAAQQLLNRVRQYMIPAEVEQVAVALQLAQQTCGGVREHSEASLPTLQRIPPLEHALAITTILTEMHIDAIGVSAGLIFEAVDAGRLSVEQVENLLGIPVARVVGSMQRLNILERTKQVGAQFHAPTDNEAEHSRDQKKRRIREALRRQQAETVRKMFVGMAEDPRVVLLKLAYRLHAMRIVSAEPRHRHLTNDAIAEQAGEIQPQSASTDLQELHLMAQETREIYAPFAGRLGMSRVESELEDLAFAILEPDKYAWIRNQVEGREQPVENLC